VGEAIIGRNLRYFVVFRRFFPLLVLLTFVPFGARAQYDPHFSHYYDMESAYNPAAVGKESKLNIVGAYAMSLAGFERNPRTFFVGADMPFYALNGYHGAGLQLVNDQIGLFTHQQINVQYSYKMRLFEGQLGIGLQVGFLNEKFNSSDLDVIDPGDEVFSTSDVNGNHIDMAAGLYYSRRNWYVGASLQHAMSPLIHLGERNELQVDRTYYLTAGYNIKLRNPFLSIPVSVFGQSDGVAYRTDVTARLRYTNEKKIMYLGLGYSPTNSVTVLVGGSFHGINVGYSYEAFTNGISLGNGSHELFVGYQTDLNLYKKGKNKHKAVRLL
jgi:type IX secretion system PorP/SprF family membrane protein